PEHSFLKQRSLFRHRWKARTRPTLLKHSITKSLKPLSLTQRVATHSLKFYLLAYTVRVLVPSKKTPLKLLIGIFVLQNKAMTGLNSAWGKCMKKAKASCRISLKLTSGLTSLPLPQILIGTRPPTFSNPIVLTFRLSINSKHRGFRSPGKRKRPEIN